MRLSTRSFVSTFVTAFGVVGVCAMFIGACTDQGEGDRCEGANGNDDCQNGLVCKGANGQANGGDGVCCPLDPALATQPACMSAPSPGGEAGIPVESGTFDVFVGDETTPIVDTGTPDDANDDAG